MYVFLQAWYYILLSQCHGWQGGARYISLRYKDPRRERECSDVSVHERSMRSHVTKVRTLFWREHESVRAERQGIRISDSDTFRR
jgi:hypothetical protein